MDDCLKNFNQFCVCEDARNVRERLVRAGCLSLQNRFWALNPCPRPQDNILCPHGRPSAPLLSFLCDEISQLSGLGHTVWPRMTFNCCSYPHLPSAPKGLSQHELLFEQKYELLLKKPKRKHFEKTMYIQQVIQSSSTPKTLIIPNLKPISQIFFNCL